MDSQNPYAAPRAAVVDPEQRGTQLAGRGARLGASMLDGLFVGIIFFPIYFLVLIKYIVGTGGGLPTHSTLVTLGAGVIYLAIFAVLNGSSLLSRGQTLGKRVVGIRIVGANGEAVHMDALLKRYAFMLVLNWIPFIGGIIALADTLCIFRESHKCLHDDVAGTIVVNA